MWRFLVPALVAALALMILFAGGMGDLKSLAHFSSRAIVIAGGAAPRRAPPAPPTAPLAAGVAVQQTRDALERQIVDLQTQADDLQNQVAQRSHELEQRSRDLEAANSEVDHLSQGLEVKRVEADKLRQDVDALRQQRMAEEDALARAKTHEKQLVTAIAPRRAPAPRAAPSRLPLAPAPAGPSAAQQLVNAQQWLAAGRSDEARRILATVQTQMVLRPVTPDQPMAEGGNPSATDVGAAIRWLDMGASGQAMQAIGRAISHANAAELPGQFPGYYWNDSTQ
jgi:hypothetical protein